MVSDSSTESRKVDKRTALSLWDTSTALPAGLGKKRAGAEDAGDSVAEEQEGVMKFTLISKKGNKTQVGLMWLCSYGQLLMAGLDKAASYSSNIGSRRAYSLCTVAGQGGTAASETVCA